MIAFIALIAMPLWAATKPEAPSLTKEAIAKQLGWVNNTSNHCGGYYIEAPFLYPQNNQKKNLVAITTDQVTFSQQGTSILQGKLSVSYGGQEITSNKAYLYRDPQTQKLTTVDFIGNVHLRAPDNLVIAKEGSFNFQTKAKSMRDLTYRTRIYTETAKPSQRIFSRKELQKQRQTTGINAWGQAGAFSQTQPKITELDQASYSTCPPLDPMWQVKASHIALDKNTGRGSASHARLLVHKVPIVYMPYFNFSIDNQRKTGFLWPTFGTSSKFGRYLTTPFYWNMAPNYDMTVTPAYLSLRGMQFSDLFRYLSRRGTGKVSASIVPHDKEFPSFQETSQTQYQSSTNPAVQAELNRLLDANATRYGISWQDNTHLNPHWSTHVDVNRVSDDYYLRDFGSDISEITQNQLLQEIDLGYKGENWNFLGRFQQYQTLHPLDSNNIVQNQYQRLPQLILNGEYPDQPYGLDYFINNEVTHFNIHKTPGVNTIQPIGQRIHTQPGIALPLNWSYLYFIPRTQLSLTEYVLTDTGGTVPTPLRRTIPIFDISSGLFFDRNVSVFNNPYQQTLEPQFYYTYVPYRNQSSVPVFDTAVNTLTYDQLFTYNRFSGIDRVGDTNQLSVGIATRLIDSNSGSEKIRAGLGEIVYFANRRVTLCNNLSCTDNPTNSSNRQTLSPLSGMLNYTLNPHWGVNGATIWNTQSKKFDNQTLNLHYQPNDRRILNLGFSFVRNGDIFSGISTNTSTNNLKLTDFSFAWPVKNDWSMVGRWSQDWNKSHFQSLLYGLQYDSCCWAMRFGGGRQFTGLSSNNTFQYNSEFYVQFALKGLGSIGSGSSSTLLSNSISGYQTTQFGQDA